MIKKRTETMRTNGTHRQSREEDRFHEFLRQYFSDIKRQVTIRGRWTIDFYINDIDVYVQFDGIYWHGLDRPIEIIRQHASRQDVIIEQKWKTDQEQVAWFAENNLTLIRIRSDHFDFKKNECDSFLEAVVSLLQRRSIDQLHDVRQFHTDLTSSNASSGSTAR